MHKVTGMQHYPCLVIMETTDSDAARQETGYLATFTTASMVLTQALTVLWHRLGMGLSLT